MHRYWDIIERTIQQNPVDAVLGGDPTPPNKVRAFLNVQYYKGGAWESRFEVCGAHSAVHLCLNNARKPQLINGKPLWALMYYLIRTGHVKEAANVASDYESAISRHEELFTTFLKSWADSSERRSGEAMVYAQVYALTAWHPKVTTAAS